MLCEYVTDFVNIEINILYQLYSVFPKGSLFYNMKHATYTAWFVSSWLYLFLYTHPQNIPPLLPLASTDLISEGISSLFIFYS